LSRKHHKCFVWLNVLGLKLNLYLNCAGSRQEKKLRARSLRRLKNADVRDDAVGGEIRLGH
jgi:hypothetical protein